MKCRDIRACCNRYMDREVAKHRTANPKDDDIDIEERAALRTLARVVAHHTGGKCGCGTAIDCLEKMSWAEHLAGKHMADAKTPFTRERMAEIARQAAADPEECPPVGRGPSIDGLERAARFVEGHDGDVFLMEKLAREIRALRTPHAPPEEKK